MDNVELIIKIVSWSVAGLTSLLSIIATVKGGKWKTLFHKVAAVNDKTTKLIELIQDAEAHTCFTGEDKLQYVLMHYLSYCISNKIDYNEESLKVEIAELIKFTKKVN